MKQALSLFVEALILGISALFLFHLLGFPVLGFIVACLIVLFALIIVIVNRMIGIW